MLLFVVMTHVEISKQIIIPEGINVPGCLRIMFNKHGAEAVDLQLMRKWNRWTEGKFLLSGTLSVACLEECKHMMMNKVKPFRPDIFAKWEEEARDKEEKKKTEIQRAEERKKDLLERSETTNALEIPSAPPNPFEQALAYPQLRRYIPSAPPNPFEQALVYPQLPRYKELDNLWPFNAAPQPARPEGIPTTPMRPEGLRPLTPISTPSSMPALEDSHPQASSTPDPTPLTPVSTPGAGGQTPPRDAVGASASEARPEEKRTPESGQANSRVVTQQPGSARRVTETTDTEFLSESNHDDRAAMTISSGPDAQPLEEWEDQRTVRQRKKPERYECQNDPLLKVPGPGGLQTVLRPWLPDEMALMTKTLPKPQDGVETFISALEQMFALYRPSPMELASIVAPLAGVHWFQLRASLAECLKPEFDPTTTENLEKYSQAKIALIAALRAKYPNTSDWTMLNVQQGNDESAFGFMTRLTKAVRAHSGTKDAEQLTSLIRQHFISGLREEIRTYVTRHLIQWRTRLTCWHMLKTSNSPPQRKKRKKTRS